MTRDMSLIEDPIEHRVLEAVRHYRLRRVREQLVASGCHAILLYDPVNIRYATDTANMQVWTMHNPSRYALVFASEDELELMYRAMRACEAGVQRMHDELRPGMTEQELWSWLHYENIRNGGEWIETRLLASGTRTNPWMQEAGERIMRQGELVGFDTDLIGPHGYCADISRTWAVGHDEPSAYQRDLYRYAFEQIQTNAELLRPGIGYRELSARAWPIPARFQANRYSFLMHGVGLGDEYPGIPHWGEDWERSGTDGLIEANMVISVESYIGEMGGAEGVKLEQQYVVGEGGAKPMCDRFWNDDWV